MAGIELEELKNDRAEYMERILLYEENLQEAQSKVQELQAVIIHTKGALAQVNTNIEAVKGRIEVEAQEKRKAEEEAAEVKRKQLQRRREKRAARS